MCISLFVLGAVFGSFAVAQVWRIRAAQLDGDKRRGDDYDAAEYKKLKSLIGQKTTKDRSRCLNCGYELRWYDLIPIISWVSLLGKCRKCRNSIGMTEILAEVTLAVLFVVSYLFFPYDLSGWVSVMTFVLWLVALVIMTVLFVYDLKWSLLPSKQLVMLIVLSVILTISLHWNAFSLDQAMSLVASLLILPGVYLVLYLASKGTWVGSGDYLIALPMALILVDWKSSLFVLFLANVLACVVAIPGLVSKKKTKKSQLPMAPFLLASFLIVFFINDLIFKVLMLQF